MARKQTTVPCKVAECDRVADGSRGWCWAHYMRWYQSKKEPTGPVASLRSTPAPCAVEGCSRNARIGDMCTPHARRVQRVGTPGRVVIRHQAGNNRGKDRYVYNGYVFLRRPDHPSAYKNGVIMEHTLVMSNLLGRPLIKGENVHHKNGDRADNRPENLELWSTHQPKGQRVADKLTWAREIIDLYGDVPPEVIT